MHAQSWPLLPSKRKADYSVKSPKVLQLSDNHLHDYSGIYLFIVQVAVNTKQHQLLFNLQCQFNPLIPILT